MPCGMPSWCSCRALWPRRRAGRVVGEPRGTFPVPLGYPYEEQVGKPDALNAGMALASERIFAFTDDDARPTTWWLQALYRCFAVEQAHAVAGRVLPHWLALRPPWLTDEAVHRIGALAALALYLRSGSTTALGGQVGCRSAGA